ncbi:N-6 DNA methylase [Serratia marcescens]|uniref:N-6 DNA methylase n=1 Tax=Serratia marcescens TaxID=615 RepID=UPI0027E3B64A|nr:N-6 DNA methylase [Serratia marcescens]MEE4612300.1 N-6 DNA methylase [Serratia marcescens]
MNPHTLVKKKELGAYYTPAELSQVLANWAIESSSDDILEPSFGGCGFFDSCISRLVNLGCNSPAKQLFGVDIDPLAFNILSKKFGTILSIENRFIQNDFIKVKPEDFITQKFDSIIGNPPYVSMHNMTETQRSSCEEILHNSPFSGQTIGRNASLWAFFLLHSLSFLKTNGRVAWVLPSSALHADYAKKLIDIYKKHFNKIRIVKLAERYFRSEGAEETSVILVGSGFNAIEVESCNFSVYSVDGISELEIILNRENAHNNHSGDNYKLDFISKITRDTYKQLNSSAFSHQLDDFIDIKIGMVTGANKVFIVNKEILEENNIPSSCIKPVIGRFSSLIGIRHTKSRQQIVENENHRVFLINPSLDQMQENDSNVKKYLSQLSDSEISKNRTFKKRTYWFSPDDNIIPDGFLSYMIHLGPRLVINQSKASCTNSIHRVFFREKTTLKNKLAISLTLLSTYSQFSAEVEGRAYSSGVLKIEPSAGKRIKILLNDHCVKLLNNLLGDVERHIKKNELYLATKIIDKALIQSGLLTQTQCCVLSEGLLFLRKERYKGVRNFDEQ